ncbi:MAG: hypothetical protein ACN6OP_19610 [Pseudomonadales bacterium]
MSTNQEEKSSRVPGIIERGFEIAKKLGYKGDICTYTAAVLPPVQLHHPALKLDKVVDPDPVGEKK